MTSKQKKGLLNESYISKLGGVGGGWVLATTSTYGATSHLDPVKTEEVGLFK